MGHYGHDLQGHVLGKLALWPGACREASAQAVGEAPSPDVGQGIAHRGRARVPIPFIILIALFSHF
jgi:hypothetical protein